MGLSFYVRLKAPAVVFSILLLAGLIAFQPLPAFARANLTAYTTTPPNTWEPKGFNVTGTAPWFVVNTLGWNYTRVLGNVGVGNGTLTALNATANRVINYTENNYMAADISMAPFDPSRLTTVSLTGAGVEEGATSNISVGEFENETGSQPEESARFLNVGEHDSDMPLNDAYHSILFGRPIDDMYYEHPHGIATNQYGRLTGLQLPGGGMANIAIRALGYAY